ncbi:MAG: 1-acyl-sn-glycerol-3-phosphate acyltransferase [Planctomycetes bacterium]|nr:1-acyl-sn-glycerol-3-phosphate acyltransferase [Planctomycetota bacterium]
MAVAAPPLENKAKGGIMAPKCYPLSVAIVKTVLCPFVKKVNGAHNIPKGPYVLVANHSSFMDGVILAGEIGWAAKKPLHMVSVSEPWNHWLWRWFMISGRNVPLDRKDPHGGEAMMGKALSWLKSGEGVGLFPEGHVNNGSKLRRARPGPALMALESGAKILPVGIRRSSEVLPLGASKPALRKIITLNIGGALDITDQSLEYRNSPQAKRVQLVKSVTDEMMREISALSGQRLARSPA